MKRFVLAFLAILMVGFFFACTFKRTIPIRYTPIIQMERLVDKDHLTVVVLGEFIDGRIDKTLFSKHLNPISIHKIKGETAGDLEQIIRDAFVDGFLKSGFEVPMGEAPTTPLLNISGRILTYNVSIKTKWSKVTFSAFVEVEVNMKRDDGQELLVVCAGNNVMESTGSISYDSAGAALDLATQDCVRKLFGDENFRNFLTK